MSEFGYRGRQLCAEAVPLASVAAAVGTPAYVYASSGMRRTPGASSRPSPGSR